MCSCILGFGMKEAMISAPFIIVLFDRIFLCSSWQEFFKFRGRCYLALGSLVAIAAYFSGFASNFISSAFLSDYGLSSFSYLVNQSKVICHYLRLSILPYGQCFDYGWPVIISPYTSLFPYVIIVLLLMAMTAWTLYKYKYIGFFGAFFFITLAPRSSFAPRPDLCVEHRMYLPLIICSCLVVFTLFRLLKLFSASFILSEKKEKFIKYSSSSIIILMALGLAISTHARNSVYKSEMSLWADTVEKSPNNPRALNYLGIEYCREGNAGKGAECFVKALEIYPDYSLALNNLANIYASMHKFDAALELYQKSVMSSPKKNTKSFIQTMNNMARLLCNKKDWDSVIKISLFLLERCPDNLNANYMMGKAFLNKHDPEKASEYFLKAMEPSVSMNDVAGKIAGDISSCPDNASTSIVLKNLLAKHSSSAELNYEYGVLLLNNSKVNEAKKCFESTSVVDFPRRAYSINNLGIIAKKEGNLQKAELLFRNAIALKPDYAGAHFNLGLLLMEKNDIDGAVAELQVAAKLAPNEDKIKKYLNQLIGKK